MSGLTHDRRASVVPLVAISVPAMMGMAALGVDAGMWYVESARLQLAADAAAMGTAFLLSSHPSTSTMQAAALQAAHDATNSRLAGTLTTPITVSAASDWSSVTVTVQSSADGFFIGTLGLGAPTMHATATAGSKPVGSCVLALDHSLANALHVDNMGTITATNCGIFSDSSASTAIYLNSGTISGKTVGAVGTVAKSNSGSNTLSPSPGTSGAASKPDPYSAMTAPTPGACSYPNGTSFTAWQATPYAFTQAKNVFCGNTTIGGNSTTDTFAPGIYYVVNGNLIFNNASITSAAGVSFVLTGTSPGALSWTNYSNTATQISAPTTGATAGIVVWQVCGASSTPANTMAGGSTLQISGAMYMPCGAFDLSNNAKLAAITGSAATVVADTIYATGSAAINATASASSGGSSSIVLSQ